MLSAFGQAFETFDRDPACRLICISAKGKHFCAGWDTSEFSALGAMGSDGLSAAFARNAEVLARISASNKIVVTIVQGACMGFGISLAARADLCLATDAATFALPELDHGIVPGMVLGDAINVLGKRTAMDWVLTRSRKSAAEALEDGLVHRIVSADAEDITTTRLLHTMANTAPSPIAATKALIRIPTTSPDFLPAAIAASTASVLSLAEGTKSQ